MTKFAELSWWVDVDVPKSKQKVHFFESVSTRSICGNVDFIESRKKFNNKKNSIEKF